MLDTDRQMQSLNNDYTKYRTELCSYVVGKFQVTRDDAEDIVHTAYARVLEIKDQSIKNPRALLYKTSYNIAIDRIRHGVVRQKHVDTVIASKASAIEELGPERIVEGDKRLSIVVKAMWEMPEKRRKLLIMSRFDGLSYAQIARRVGLSETSVRKHISKGLLDCQRALQKKGYIDD
ncbi:MAG: RNA polymerase sigma factor [Porticoccaceae bacterium]